MNLGSAPQISSLSWKTISCSFIFDTPSSPLTIKEKSKKEADKNHGENSSISYHEGYSGSFQGPIEKTVSQQSRVPDEKEMRAHASVRHLIWKIIKAPPAICWCS